MAGLLGLCILLTGCTTAVESSQAPVAPESAPQDGAETVDSALETAPAEETPAEPDLSEEAQALIDSGLFKKREITGTFDEGEAIPLTVDNPDITQAGTYIVSGAFKDTTITISVADTDKVQIVLDNAAIENGNGPAIYVAQADKVYITAKEGTENVISDGSDYVYSLDEKADGAIFSRADLAINGAGSLTVTGNCKHGVVSKDDLVLAIDHLAVNAQSTGLSGKDSLRIGWGEIHIISGGDGMKSDNQEDTDKGFVYVADCDLTIQAGKDCIQGDTMVTLLGGTYVLTAGGGTDGEMLDELESYKGIKSGVDIEISGGDYQINALDDAIHSDNNVTISGGSFQIATGDDGVHANETLNVSGGDILITQSYEGLEGTELYISGGNIDITASDDGLNAAGDADETDFDGFPGPFGNGVGDIYISGGYIVINAEGDGIDSNDTMNVSGGVVLVSGPSWSMNGALDCDGGSTITGGVVVATGASGMAQGFGTAENQGSILATITSQSGGTPIALCDKDGNVVVSFTPVTDYSSIAVSTPGVQSGNTYTIVVGGEVADADENGFAENTTITGGETLSTIEMTSQIYNQGGFGGPGGGPGGRPGGGPGGGPGFPGGPGGFPGG